jgi:pimeloyl-ACP methyl ester carboxylesterase
VRSTRRLVTAVLAAVTLTLAAGPGPAAAQSAPRQSPCPGQERFGCGTLTVPLDWSARVPGTIGIKFAAQRGVPSSRKLLIALSGGPGQPAIEGATAFTLSLQPALSRYRLAVLDQRGTGTSGVLRCPNVQRLRSLDAIRPGAVAGCAARLGPRRAFYATSDTVLDIEALRKALGADKVALMGISYGTHVALQYARAFPQNVDRLILDSVVGPNGPEPFLLDTYRNLPRVLREQCRAGRCRGITNDPVADLAALVQRLNASGPLRGTYVDERGRRRRTAYASPDELAFLLIEGDLNPLLQAALPGAISAARRGDLSALMRLRRIGQGAPTRTSDLSIGLNVTTGCLDRRAAAGDRGGRAGRDPAGAARAVRRADRVPDELRRRLPPVAQRRGAPAVHRPAARRARAAARRAPGSAHADRERARHRGAAPARERGGAARLGP